eukprot:CAMPEP_0203635008 /NCGR_PEP_ID=MMETSP0088-20131115/1864_1 /ASSEMBLY_ACC=CAM_ASM_001087 /TAXON_ID=426623 /ORGANISM="Chaetoceros affinis, Strain CCMP159" /LENGTH=164 /DNA_ID=CAMNT_0050488745 /DNA_START=216 /DNA_END=706 /DNA_ORIENTATION=-
MVKCLYSFIENGQNTEQSKNSEQNGTAILRSLIHLWMVCTHPLLFKSARHKDNFDITEKSLLRFDASGKLCALYDLLGNARIFHNDLTAADNDQSLIHVQNFDSISERKTSSFDFEHDKVLFDGLSNDEERTENSGPKCLIFAMERDEAMVKLGVGNAFDGAKG